MSIFRAYDIRGLYPGEVNEELAEALGKAFGTYLNKGSAQIAVGGDVRLSTPSLARSLVRGLLSTGARVTDLGMVPTPALYFAVASLGLDGGMVVTASHNPKEYNGFKPVGKQGVCLSWDTGIREIKEILDAGSFRSGKGTLKAKDISSAYTTHLTGKVSLKKKLRVVVDAGNGACGRIAPAVFSQLGCDTIPLYCEPDGRFPNHEADPVKKKNLAALQEKVRETGAGLGVAYDTDGDRLGVVDEQGNIVESSTIFSLFIQGALARRPGSPVVYEVVVSKAVEDTIRSSGGKPVLSRVGHSFIQAALTQHGAVLGGENSGHYYFPENFGYDDAIFASLKIAELASSTPLSQLSQSVPRYLTSEELRPVCPDERKFAVVESLQKRFAKEGHSVNTLDGARVTLERGWFIIRASNTAPQLVVRWEAQDRASFKAAEALVRNALKGEGVSL